MNKFIAVLVLMAVIAAAVAITAYFGGDLMTAYWQGREDAIDAKARADVSAALTDQVRANTRILERQDLREGVQGLLMTLALCAVAIGNIAVLIRRALVAADHDRLLPALTRRHAPPIARMIPSRYTVAYPVETPKEIVDVRAA